jgi:hypothetical protein
MRYRDMSADIVNRIGESKSEEMSPQAINVGHGNHRSFASGHQTGKFFATIGRLIRINFGPEIGGISNLHQAASFFKVDRSRKIPFDNFRIVVNHPASLLVKPAMINFRCLSEETVELPELILFPVVEWMVMALSTLNLHPHEQPGRLGRHLGAVVLILHLSQQEIRRTVFFVMTFGRHEIRHNVLPGAVFAECLTEELLHPFATDATRGLLSNTKIGPDRGPVPSVTRIVEQSFDQFGSLGFVFVRQKFFNVFHGGNVTDNVEIHPAHPLGVIGHRGRLNLVVFPGLANLRIDLLNDDV